MIAVTFRLADQVLPAFVPQNIESRRGPDAPNFSNLRDTTFRDDDSDAFEDLPAAGIAGGGYRYRRLAGRGARTGRSAGAIDVGAAVARQRRVRARAARGTCLVLHRARTSDHARRRAHAAPGAREPCGQPDRADGCDGRARAPALPATRHRLPGHAQIPARVHRIRRSRGPDCGRSRAEVSGAGGRRAGSGGTSDPPRRVPVRRRGIVRRRGLPGAAGRQPVRHCAARPATWCAAVGCSRRFVCREPGRVHRRRPEPAEGRHDAARS